MSRGLSGERYAVEETGSRQGIRSGRSLGLVDGDGRKRET